MKKLILVLLLIPLISIAQTKKKVKKIKVKTPTVTNVINTVDISAGVKILIPEELQRVDTTLRKLGMGSLVDDGIKSLNRAAEDAVKESTPIFINAIKNISISDAKGILLGNESAATSYLKDSTTKELYAKFNPVVQESIGKVGADVIWNSIIKKYNTIPLVNKVNPDISDYVTTKAMEGVFKMIAVEEKNIREKLTSRNSDLLKSVFALQDKK